MKFKRTKKNKKAFKPMRDKLYGRVINKIHKGLPLNSEEYSFLFSSRSWILSDQTVRDSLSLFNQEEVDNFTGEIAELFQEETPRVSKYLNLWCPDVELEMIQYFKTRPEEMYNMPPRKFEELVAAIFKNNGFRVELTPATRDGGIDIIAVEDSIITGESVHLVECKRYATNQRVGIGIVQRLLGVVTQMQATKGIIVTTSYFTSDAVEAALNTKHILTLRDYDVLVEWLKSIVPKQA